MASAGISRAGVIAAAAALADRDGFGALTLRALAKDLRIQPPSLYNHVESFEALRRELWMEGNRQLASAITKSVVGRSGDDAVRSLANAYRSFAKARPGLYASTLVAAPDSDAEAQALASSSLTLVVAVLDAYHLGPDDSVHAVRMLRSVLHGFVALEVTGAFGLPMRIDETFTQLISTLIVGLRGNL